MSYLDRLKLKISEDAPKYEATKVSEAPFVPFVAPGPAPFCQISTTTGDHEALEARKITLLDPTKPHWAWRLTYPDGSTQEQFTLPEATHAEILKLWPEVIAAEPFNPVKSESVPVTPQNDQNFNEVMQHHRFAAEEIELARQAYQNDPAAGKRTYAALRAEFHPDSERRAAGVMWDERRSCSECANLDPDGHCRAAQALGASRHYRPVQDQPRHCEAYQAPPGEPAAL